MNLLANDNRNNYFSYTPSYENRINSNISRFMRRYGIEDYIQLVRKSNEDIEWYWNAVNEDLNLEWFRSTTKLLTRQMEFHGQGGL
jgi:acetyl-CoA synthetase